MLLCNTSAGETLHPVMLGWVQHSNATLSRCCMAHQQAPSGGIPNSSGVSGLASAAVAGGAAAVDAAAVDIRPVSGQSNMYCCVFPGLNSKDVGTSRLSQALAQALGGESRSVLFTAFWVGAKEPSKSVGVLVVNYAN